MFGENGDIRLRHGQAGQEDYKDLKTIVDKLSPAKQDEPSKISEIRGGHFFQKTTLANLGTKVTASTLIKALTKANTFAQQMLTSPLIVDVYDREKIKDQIKGREHVIKQLNEKVMRGEITTFKQDLYKAAMKALIVAFGVFVGLPLGALAVALVTPALALLTLGALGVGPLALIYISTKKILEKAIEHYKNKAIPKIAKKNADILMKALNTDPSSKAAEKKIPNFQEIYKQQQSSSPIQAKVQGEETAEIAGRNKILSRKNRALITALKKGKFEDAQFIIEKGLFKRVDIKLLRCIDRLSTESDSDKKHFLKLLFEHCKDAQSLSKLTDYMVETDRTDFAKMLIRQGLADIPPLKTSVHDKKAIEQNVLLNNKRTRCQMLAASMGDLDLFNEAFKGSGIAISEDLFKPGDEAKLEAVIQKFINLESSCLEDVTKNGQNIMQYAALGEKGAAINAFLHEVMVQKTQEDIKNINKNVIAPLKALRDGKEINIQQVNRLRAGLQGVMNIMEGENPRSWHKGVSRYLSRRLHPTKEVNSLYSYLKTNNRSKFLKNVTELNGELDKLRTRLYNANNLLKGTANKEATGGLDEADRALAETVFNKVKEAKERLAEAKDPFLMKDRDGVMPVQLMSMTLANNIDRLLRKDGNKKGSLSNAVGYFYLINRNIPKRCLLGSVTGEYAGALIATAALESNPNLGAVVRGVASNSLIIGGLIAGGLFFRYLKRSVMRGHKARKLGIEKSLSLYTNRQKVNIFNETDSPAAPFTLKLRRDMARDMTTEQSVRTPYSYLNALDALNLALKKRDLTKIKDILDNDTKYAIVLSKTEIKKMRTMHSFIVRGKDERGAILKQLCERCPDKETAFRLLNDQVELGHSVEVGKAINGIMTSLVNKEKWLSPQQRGMIDTCLLVAAKIGSLPGQPDFLDKVIQQTKSLSPDPSFLLTVTDPKTGNNLLHMAAQSNKLGAVTLIADEMIKASDGAEIEYTRPRIGITSFLKYKTIKTKLNIFEMKNASGKTMYDMINRTLANNLDASYRFNPVAPGSFSALYRRREDKFLNKIKAEVLSVGPIKTALSLGVSTIIPSLIQGAAVFADAHIPLSGAGLYTLNLFVQSTAMFGLELGVILAGCGSALILGNPLGEAITIVQDQKKKRKTKLTQFDTSNVESMKAQTAFARNRTKGIDELHQSLTEEGVKVQRQALSYALDKYITLYESKKDPALRSNLSDLKKLQAHLLVLIKAGGSPRKIIQEIGKRLDGLSQVDRDGFLLNYYHGLDISMKAYNQ